ncbi:hypothetical protein MOR12E_28755 [Methylobacterium oryzae]
MRNDPSHLRFIRSLPCCACYRAGAQAAHVRRGGGGGMGLKPPDNCCVPLCADCHREQHNRGEVSFWKDMDQVHQLANDLYAVTGRRDDGEILIYRFWKERS